MSLREPITLLGVILIGGGIFAPLIRVEAPDLFFIETNISASFNMLELSEPASALYMAISGIALFGIAKRWLMTVWLSGVGGIGLTLYGVYASQRAIENSRDYALFRNPIGRSVGNALLEGVRLQWGWGLLLMGSLLVVLAAIISAPKTKRGRF